MKKWYWFLLSVVVILLDQASKHWVETHFIPYQPAVLIPMLNVTLAYNSGAAFSFLSGAGSWHPWFFLGFGLVMSVLLAIWMLRLSAKARLQLGGISLILGGALGNLCDRLLAGHVVDFIEVYYKNHHWPVFNLADTAICLGAFLLIIDLCKNSAR